MSQVIKIGLDFHGVITEHTAYFSRFTELALQSGCEIHIITGGPLSTVQQYLSDNHIQYTSIFAIFDYYNSMGDVKFFDNGEFKIPDDMWNSAKGAYCREQAITLHIDDSNKYAKWFTTPYCQYNEQKQQCCIAPDWAIDFSQSPEVALLQIKALVALHRA